MNIFDNPDIALLVVDYLPGIPGYSRINTTMNKLATEKAEQYRLQMDNKYPLWDLTIEELEGENIKTALKNVQEVALYHMNMAAIDKDWDAIRIIAEFHKGDPQILIDAISLLFINDNKKLSKYLYDLYRSYIPDNMGFSIIDYYDSIENNYDPNDFARKVIKLADVDGFNSVDAAILVNKQVSRKIRDLSDKSSLLNTVVRRVPGKYDHHNLNLLGSIALNPTNLSIAVAEIDISNINDPWDNHAELYVDLLFNLRYHTMQSARKVLSGEIKRYTRFGSREVNPVLLRQLKAGLINSGDSLVRNIVYFQVANENIFEQSESYIWFYYNKFMRNLLRKRNGKPLTRGSMYYDDFVF